MAGPDGEKIFLRALPEVAIENLSPKKTPFRYFYTFSPFSYQINVAISVFILIDFMTKLK